MRDSLEHLRHHKYNCRTLDFPKGDKGISIFDVKDAPRIGSPVVKNVKQITEIIKIDRHVSSRSITQELKIDHKTVYSHLRKVGFKKKLHELLPHDQTLESNIYCQQLDLLKLAIHQKWPELANRRVAVFHQDNVRTHTFVGTRQNLWELGGEILIHPPYIPDLAPSDYHIFLPLQNCLIDKKFGSKEDCENRLLDIFANKGQDFYERGLMKPPLKCPYIAKRDLHKSPQPPSGADFRKTHYLISTKDTFLPNFISVSLTDQTQNYLPLKPAQPTSRKLGKSTWELISAMPVAYGYLRIKRISSDGEPFSGLKLASLKRRWLDRWKSSPGSKINTKRVVLSPGSSAKVATEHQHLHRIAT
ncbi:mariner Mos1 transposase [Trichonephila clavipes]|nr:mariner Mos1 transposase [Trichonephila clavipes]